MEHIKVTVVKTVKSSVSAEDALRIAAKFNLETTRVGATPLEALKEWDMS